MSTKIAAYTSKASGLNFSDFACITISPAIGTYTFMHITATIEPSVCHRVGELFQSVISLSYYLTIPCRIFTKKT